MRQSWGSGHVRAFPASRPPPRPLWQRGSSGMLLLSHARSLCLKPGHLGAPGRHPIAPRVPPSHETPRRVRCLTTSPRTRNWKRAPSARSVRAELVPSASGERSLSDKASRAWYTRGICGPRWALTGNISTLNPKRCARGAAPGAPSKEGRG